MHRIIHAAAGFAIALLVTYPAHAAVNDTATNGFSVTERIHIAAPPSVVYDALVAPARWWSSEHTFSHNAASLALDARAGGCWCETLPDGGSVQHLSVVFAKPGKKLVMRGALGPLQPLGVAGSMTITLNSAANGTELSLTYNVGGYLKDGLESLAAPVDRVLGEQVARLKFLIETGTPDAKQ